MIVSLLAIYRLASRVTNQITALALAYWYDSTNYNNLYN